MKRISESKRLGLMRAAALAVTLTLFAPAALRAQTATRDRIEKRTYAFQDAKREQEYAIFVPSNYDANKKTPLIVALHGLGGNPRQILSTSGFTDLAEKHGYIVVAPYGYNERGWYGAFGPSGGMGRGRAARGAAAAGDASRNGAPPAANAQAPPATPGQPPARAGRGGRLGAGRGLAAAADDPPNLGELSEKDVLNVLELVRKQYSVDPDRTYLMGHSMGGGGTWYIGTKYAQNWAALAPFAPAIWLSPDTLADIKQTPVLVVQGDNDQLVNVAGTRRWVDKMKELGMTHEYIEVAGGTHMSVVPANLDKMFEFFEKHKRSAAK